MVMRVGALAAFAVATALATAAGADARKLVAGDYTAENEVNTNSPQIMHLYRNKDDAYVEFFIARINELNATGDECCISTCSEGCQGHVAVAPFGFPTTPVETGTGTESSTVTGTIRRALGDDTQVVWESTAHEDEEQLAFGPGPALLAPKESVATRIRVPSWPFATDSTGLRFEIWAQIQGQVVLESTFGESEDGLLNMLKAEAEEDFELVLSKNALVDGNMVAVNFTDTFSIADRAIVTEVTVPATAASSSIELFMYHRVISKEDSAPAPNLVASVALSLVAAIVAVVGL